MLGKILNNITIKLHKNMKKLDHEIHFQYADLKTRSPNVTLTFFRDLHAQCFKYLSYLIDSNVDFRNYGNIEI